MQPFRLTSSRGARPGPWPAPPHFFVVAVLVLVVLASAHASASPAPAPSTKNVGYVHSSSAFIGNNTVLNFTFSAQAGSTVVVGLAYTAGSYSAVWKDTNHPSGAIGDLFNHEQVCVSQAVTLLLTYEYLSSPITWLSVALSPNPWYIGFIAEYAGVGNVTLITPTTWSVCATSGASSVTQLADAVTNTTGSVVSWWLTMAGSSSNFQLSKGTQRLNTGAWYNPTVGDAQDLVSDLSGAVSLGDTLSWTTANRAAAISFHFAVPFVTMSVAISSTTRCLSGTFNATTSGTSLPVSYLWTFGDGTNDTANPTTHRFPAGGTYTVSVVATDSGSSTATNSTSVTVADCPGSGGFTVPPIVPEPIRKLFSQFLPLVCNLWILILLALLVVAIAWARRAARRQPGPGAKPK